MPSKRSLSTNDTPRVGIRMIISPAETFDLAPMNDVQSNLTLTNPDCCIEKSAAIAQSMKRMSKTEMAKVLKLSPALSNVTSEYWSQFNIEATTQSTMCKPCIFMYSGAAYQGISILECDNDTVAYMQDNLRILDAVYGVLRPLDLIHAYRLEMDTKGIVLSDTNDPIRKLSTYWSDAITARLTKDLQKNQDSNELPVLLNLASDEYVAAIDMDLISQHCRFIKIIFYEDSKIVSVHAKRARGLMVRYISELKATALEQVQEFNVEGYTYVHEKSTDDTLVFNRPKNYRKPSSIGTTSLLSHDSSTGIANKRSKQR